jgi:hypothetical protein
MSKKSIDNKTANSRNEFSKKLIDEDEIEAAIKGLKYGDALVDDTNFTRLLDKITVLLKVEDKVDKRLIKDLLDDGLLMDDELGEMLTKYYTYKKKLVVPDEANLLFLANRLKDKP